MNRKLVSVMLTASTVVWGLGIATLPLAQAQTTTDLQAQIAALLAQIQQLQSQLNGSSASTGSSYAFTKDLTLGSKGADVSALQQLLINGGYLTAVSAPTGYFGSLTQAALAKWQAAKGISPAAGYFGPKTRAYLASTGTGTGTSTGTGTTSVTPPATGLAVSLSASNPTSGSLVTSASGQTTSAARVPVLAINLTASNSGAVTVNEIKIHKTGVLSDSSIAGAYLTQNGQVLFQYNSLNQGVIDFSGLNFSVPAGQTQTLWVAIDPSTGLAAGNTVGFAVNAATDISAADASNNAITPSGMFPLTGSTFTVTTVSSPALAGLAITTSSIATQVTAGTQGNIVGAWSFNGSNSLVWLKGIKFTVIGSANMADIRNVKLMINGTQAGQTLATVAQNGAAFFDLSAASAGLNTGNNNVQISADVMGSPAKNFQFEVLNSYDVLAVDSQYNIPILVSLTSGADALVAIQQGAITVTQDSNTPTGNVAAGQSGVVLAKFDVYAAGEAVKIKFLDFTITLTGQPTGNTSTFSTQLKNIALVDDAGGQVGTTINTPPSSNICTQTTVAATYSSSTGIYSDCFGTSGSPINYIIPANTTRVLSLKADIQSTAAFTTVVGKLVQETVSNNLQGLISSQTAASAGVSGSSLSLASSLLTVAKNAAYGNQNITPNTTGAHIGSYAFTASSASGVQINTVSIMAGSSGASATTGDIQNLKLMVGGTQFGTTQGIVTDSSTYTFSGAPFTVPAGGTTYVEVYADVLSSAANMSPATTLSACSGTGIVSYNAVSCSGSQAGQYLTVASAGATMTVGIDSSAPAATNLVMGSTGNVVAAYRFAETTNYENVKITDLTITQNVTSSKAGFQNVGIYNGSTVLGTAGSAVALTTPATSTAIVTLSGLATSTATGTYTLVVDGFNVTTASVNSGTATTSVATTIAALTYPSGITASSAGGVISLLATAGYHTLSVAATQRGFTLTASPSTFGTVGGYTYSFHFGTPVVVPQANSVTLTLKGDVASYSSQGSADNSTSTFAVSSVTALGQSSNLTTNVTGGAVGNSMRILRTVVTPSATALGNTSNRTKQAVDNLANITFTANSAGSAMLQTLKLSFSGNAIATSTNASTTYASTTYSNGGFGLMSNVTLRDANNTDVVGSDGATATTTCTSQSTCTVTWTFATSTGSPFVISGGSSYSFILQANTQSSAGTLANGGTGTQGLGATISGASDVSYYDTGDTSGNTITLPSTIVPLSVTSVAFTAGS